MSTNYAVPPGEFVAEWLGENDVSRETLAFKLGVGPTYVDYLLAGKVALSDEVLERLQALTGITVNTWKRIEERYQADILRLQNADESPQNATS